MSEDDICLHFWVVVVTIFFGFYLLFILAPSDYDSNKAWSLFQNNCCKIYYNEKRCIVHNTCRVMLKYWIYLQNDARQFLDECCYHFAPYSHWKYFAETFCDPECLKSK